MRKVRVLSKLELKQVLRARALPYTLLLLTVVGSAAVLMGSARVREERVALATREAFLAEQASHLVAAHKNDLGLLFYYLAMPTEHSPNAWTPLAAGLRDMHPYSQHLRMLGLTPQLYAGELSNPLKQLAGGFDYAFVVVFLLPLLVIGLGYDVRSRDRELGTDLLLRSQPTRVTYVVALRLMLRAGFVAALALGSFSAVALALALPLDLRIAWWMIALVGYLGFWTALVLLVSAWHRSSGWNATVLIGAWLALCVVLPALANATLMDAPTRSGIELTLSQREVMNAGWDRPKRLTMDPFLARHPEYRASQPPAEAFSWPWYYAMHEAADLHVAANVAAYDKALAAREQRTSALAMVLPPLALSRALTHFAGTDLNAHLAYKASVAQYHEALKRIMYPLLFGGASTADLQVEVLPRHHFAPEPKQPHWSELLSIWVQAAFVLMLGLLGAAYRGGWPGWRRLARRRGGR